MTDGSLQLWNNIGKRSLSFFVFNINRHNFLTCEQRLHFPWVSWRAKSSLCGQLFNFLSCMREIRHAIREQNQIVRSVVKWREFRGNKKIATTLICYARPTQCSKPVKNSEKKNPFSWFIRPDFWTDLNGCRQRLLFARQLTQRKCSLCSQGNNFPAQL